MCQALAARLSAIEVAQTYYHQVVAEHGSKPAATLPRSVVVDAAFYLPTAAGFYGVEYEPGGVAFRWTGPQPTFYFELLVDRASPARLCLEYRRIFADVPGADIACLVDGQPLQTTHCSIAGGFEIAAALPRRTEPGGTVVMFVCPRVQAPADCGKGTDARKLGLAFRKLTVEPAEDAVSPAETPVPGRAVPGGKRS